MGELRNELRILTLENNPALANMYGSLLDFVHKEASRGKKETAVQFDARAKNLSTQDLIYTPADVEWAARLLINDGLSVNINTNTRIATIRWI